MANFEQLEKFEYSQRTNAFIVIVTVTLFKVEKRKGVVAQSPEPEAHVKNARLSTSALNNNYI